MKNVNDNCALDDFASTKLDWEVISKADMTIETITSKKDEEPIIKSKNSNADKSHGNGVNNNNNNNNPSQKNHEIVVINNNNSSSNSNDNNNDNDIDDNNNDELTIPDSIATDMDSLTLQDRIILVRKEEKGSVLLVTQKMDSATTWKWWQIAIAIVVTLFYTGVIGWLWQERQEWKQTSANLQKELLTSQQKQQQQLYQNEKEGDNGSFQILMDNCWFQAKANIELGQCNKEYVESAKAVWNDATEYMQDIFTWEVEQEQYKSKEKQQQRQQETANTHLQNEMKNDNDEKIVSGNNNESSFSFASNTFDLSSLSFQTMWNDFIKDPSTYMKDTARNVFQNGAPNQYYKVTTSTTNGNDKHIPSQSFLFSINYTTELSSFQTMWNDFIKDPSTYMKDTARTVFQHGATNQYYNSTTTNINEGFLLFINHTTNSSSSSSLQNLWNNFIKDSSIYVKDKARSVFQKDVTKQQ